MALGHRGAGGVEVVPVQQDRHHGQDPEQELAGTGGAERTGRPTVPDRVPRGGRQVGHDRAHLAEQPSRLFARLEDRAEQVAAHGGRHRAGRHVAAAGHQQGDGRAALGVAGGRVHAEGDDAADRADDAADRR